jgi:hypothetical protein
MSLLLKLLFQQLLIKDIQKPDEGANAEPPTHLNDLSVDMGLQLPIF